MKKVTLIAFTIYNKIVSPIIKQIVGVNNSCRFYPTCSEYAKISIEKEGFLKGSYKAIVRLLKCQPFYSLNKI